jgi:hypothetical protein
MKLPGEASLDFEISPVGGPPGGCRLVQTASFAPMGLGGILYWYAITPLHGFVFSRLLKGTARRAELGRESQLSRA